MKTVTYDETKWVLVPVEPTDEMVEAAWDSDAADYVGEHKRIHSLGLAWSAMLAAAPSAQGVDGLPQPFGYIEPRPDLSGYEVFDDPGPRRAAIWNMHGMQQALAQQPAAVDEAMVMVPKRDALILANFANFAKAHGGAMEQLAARRIASLATQHQEPKP